jgi:hypothetical protein
MQIKFLIYIFIKFNYLTYSTYKRKIAANIFGDIMILIRPNTYTDVWLEKVCTWRNSRQGAHFFCKIVASGAFALLIGASVIETVARTILALYNLPCNSSESGAQFGAALLSALGGAASLVCFLETLAGEERVTG